jgi:uncharacterized membrane protein YfcA
VETLLVAAILFFASFGQGLAGFGTALLAMPLLCPLIGVKLAAPLMTLSTILMQIVMLIRYRTQVSLGEIWRLVVASMIGVAIGIFSLRHVDEKFILAALGVVLVAYSLYSILAPEMPRIVNPNWSFAFGFASGVLGGAYNTDGPPVIVYGSCRGWEPAAFKSNLQGFFMFNAVAIVLAHAVNGNLTPQVWSLFLYAAPPIVIGAILGLSVDKWLKPELFRKIVLAFLLIVGVKLILSSLITHQ